MRWNVAKRLGGVGTIVVATAMVCGLTAGCKSSGSGASAVKLDPATLGSVSGVVKFTGKAPEPVLIDTTMDPGCSMGTSGDAYSEQYAVKDGKLGNVYVYVKSGPSAITGYTGPTPQPVVLDQKGCLYEPHVIAVMVGQPVEFRNEDPTMHNVHTMPAAGGNAVLDISQGPKAAPQTKHFDKPEAMMPVRCNNHPWMDAFINVSATPWFAVTGPDGKFELKGLPPGDYVLGAVHEKLGEQTIKVTVAAKAQATGEFAFAMK